jgi:hypothetical protein
VNRSNTGVVVAVVRSCASVVALALTILAGVSEEIRAIRPALPPSRETGRQQIHRQQKADSRKTDSSMKTGCTLAGVTVVTGAMNSAPLPFSICVRNRPKKS